MDFFHGNFYDFFSMIEFISFDHKKNSLENRKTTTNTNLESWQDGNEIKLFVDLEFWKYVKWISIVKSDFSPLLQFLNFNMMVRWNHYCGWVKLLFLFFKELLQVFDFIFEPLFFLFCVCLFVCSLYFDKWSNQNLAQKWACQYVVNIVNIMVNIDFHGWISIIRME